MIFKGMQARVTRDGKHSLVCLWYNKIPDGVKWYMRTDKVYTKKRGLRNFRLPSERN